MSKNIALLTLQTFSTTGGIQKMTRTLAHALNEITKRRGEGFCLYSLYDKPEHLMQQYLPAKKFKGFGSKLVAFILSSLKLAKSGDTVIISHVNMAIVGILIKMINPKCRVTLIAHGIEVWRYLSYFKKKLLFVCDDIVCVSTFTKQEMVRWHRVDADKCIVLNNAIDPFMRLPESFDKPQYLFERYGLQQDDTILFTLTRLAHTEQYKGYENVIVLINKLKIKFPKIKYVLSGKYDDIEEARIKTIIQKHGVDDHVLLTGFINEHELADHFLMADLFVLPSIKEGFGIVFIESLSCGLPVVCGNVDGSVDAIRNGELGKAVGPDDLIALGSAITEYLENPPTTTSRSDLKTQCLKYFNEADYIKKLETILYESGK
jgi:phosphatidyl-myo-inositol dimannoside synthase